MDSWPTENRSNISNKKGMKGKEIRRIVSHYPYIEQGSVSALSLFEKNGHLLWTSITPDQFQEGAVKKLRAGKAINVFPATRAPSLDIPNYSIARRAEQSANFLRKYLPDVDITAELIREHIAEAGRISRNLDAFNPYSGNLLASLLRDSNSSRRTGWLAFPMGESNLQLNLTPFSVSTEGIMIQPRVQPAYAFSTPIEQIIFSQNRSTSCAEAANLAIRTYGSTSILGFTEDHTSQQDVEANEIAKVLRSDINDQTIVDLKLLSSPLEAIFITDCGQIYSRSFAGNETTVFHGKSQSTDPEDDLFWRLGLIAETNHSVLISSKKATLLDFRLRKEVEFFRLPSGIEVLTSVEDCHSDNVVRMCSTSQVLWLDQRYSGRPLLGYKHERQYDRYLATQTIYLDRPLTMCTSRRNGLIMVYDVSREENQPIHVHTSPYHLKEALQRHSSYVGQALLDPCTPNTTQFGFLRLSENGSIHGFSIDYSDVPGVFRVAKSPALQSLEAATDGCRPDIGPLGCRDISRVDFRPAYNALFCAHWDEKRKAAEKNTEAVYELIEGLRSFWQGNDAPMEHMLTTFDIAFRAGEEPESSLRADSLSESILNSIRGYRALRQGLLSAQFLGPGSSWHYDMKPTLHRFDEELSLEVETLADRLHRFDLVVDDSREFQTLTRENFFREQLALDIALSRDIYSAHPFVNTSKENHDLETMTEALSLANEPPFEFGYLRPIYTSSGDEHYTKMEKREQGLDFPIGVRLLLKDWEVGTRADEYLYRESNEGLGNTPQANFKRHKSFADTPENKYLHLSRPPAVVAMSSMVPTSDVAEKARIIAQSQDNRILKVLGFGSQPLHEESQASQHVMTSTQILPGPYGGRPLASKKKPVKKRIGGF